MTRKHIALIIVAIVLFVSAPASADRLKDISRVMGSRANQLVGYGIVVGLNSTGDGAKADFTLQSVAAMLRRLGVRVDPKKIKIKNAAAVMVTADLQAFTRAGQRIDVLVSSLGDAKSLRGGTLIQTPLLGADRNVYAVAQGPLSVGGFSAGGSGSSKTSGHPTVGRVPGGALIEQEIPTSLEFQNTMRLTLKHPDPATAARAAAAINEKLEGPFATAEDPGMVKIKIPEPYRGKTMELLALIGDVDIAQDRLANIVSNERIGPVVGGPTGRRRAAASGHGGVTLQSRDRSQVS
ncbi:MAG: flagellar basal body P-ring protein FlgI, partial [Deltaproteobacteria bacterium]|nr:flagellar basal body P-ring protein FlgI [Deltaproteobacteria bacterium]